MIVYEFYKYMYLIVRKYEKAGMNMNFNAKLINTAYEMSTILSFAFSLDFIIMNRDITLLNGLMLMLWLLITAKGSLKIVLDRVVLNVSGERIVEKSLFEIKKAFNEDKFALIIYMLLAILAMCIKIAIPFIIILL